MNQVILIGRLARDVERKETQGGKVYCRFSLAVDRGMSKAKKEEANAKGIETVDFIPCTAWDKTAETLSNYTEKGCRIMVTGVIQRHSYEDKNGKKATATDIVVRHAEIIDFKASNNEKEAPEEDDFFKDFEEVSEDDRIPF